MTALLERRGFDDDAIAGERRLLADTLRQRAVLLQQPLRTADCAALFAVALERVQLANALGESRETDAAVRDACAWACAAELGGRCARGEATIEFAGERAHRATADGTHLSPPRWIDALAIACIARDSGARAVFADPELFALAADGPRSLPASVGDEPFWLPYGRSFAALVAGDGRAEQYAHEAIGLLSRASPIDQENLMAVDLPLLECIAALAAGVRDGWRQRISAALGSFHAYYNRPEFKELLPGYMPAGLTAIYVLARERGATIEIDSPYLQAARIAGPPTARVALEAPRRRARTASEIRWWFDLAGVPLERRTHRLVDRGDALVAIYEGTYADSGPQVRAEFLLDERGPELLDAGELMFAAELHARRAADGSDRARLHEAIDALNALLARIPASAEAVPATAFTTPAGVALRARAPGRFERARILAVRDEYARLLRPAENATGDPAQDARAGSLVWIEVIRGQLVELLDRLPVERDLLRALRPQDEDYAKIFMPEAVDQARAAYTKMWNARMEVEAPPDASCAAHIHIAPAGMLREDNELSRKFPGGYRTIAQRLNPQRVWVCWRYARPGERPEINYDGLVWCDDHWIWLPKPYRVL